MYFQVYWVQVAENMEAEVAHYLCMGMTEDTVPKKWPALVAVSIKVTFYSIFQWTARSQSRKQTGRKNR